MNRADKLFQDVENAFNLIKDRYKIPSYKDADYYDYHSIEELIKRLFS